jgi:hypothetical protein
VCAYNSTDQLLQDHDVPNLTLKNRIEVSNREILLFFLLICICIGLQCIWQLVTLIECRQAAVFRTQAGEDHMEISAHH